MLFCDFFISNDSFGSHYGQNSICIVLPVFSDAESPCDADVLNRFYSQASETIFRYAESCSDPQARRSCFSCRSEVCEENEKISVTLTLSYSAVYIGKRMSQRRRIITHNWAKKRSGGNYSIISREITK